MFFFIRTARVHKVIRLLLIENKNYRGEINLTCSVYSAKTGTTEGLVNLFSFLHLSTDLLMILRCRVGDVAGGGGGIKKNVEDYASLYLKSYRRTGIKFGNSFVYCFIVIPLVSSCCKSAIDFDVFRR